MFPLNFCFMLDYLMQPQERSVRSIVECTMWGSYHTETCVIFKIECPGAQEQSTATSAQELQLVLGWSVTRGAENL